MKIDIVIAIVMKLGIIMMKVKVLSFAVAPVMMWIFLSGECCTDGKFLTRENIQLLMDDELPPGYKRKKKWRKSGVRVGIMSNWVVGPKLKVDLHHPSYLLGGVCYWPVTPSSFPHLLLLFSCWYGVVVVSVSVFIPFCSFFITFITHFSRGIPFCWTVVHACPFLY